MVLHNFHSWNIINFYETQPNFVCLIYNYSPNKRMKLKLPQNKEKCWIISRSGRAFYHFFFSLNFSLISTENLQKPYSCPSLVADFSLSKSLYKGRRFGPRNWLMLMGKNTDLFFVRFCLSFCFGSIARATGTYFWRPTFIILANCR